jgi:decaprenylphospho-beta-D-ribofuranose 2-oxidase
MITMIKKLLVSLATQAIFLLPTHAASIALAETKKAQAIATSSVVQGRPQTAALAQAAARKAHLRQTKALFDIASPTAVQIPATTQELQQCIVLANTHGKKISVVGTGKSQGGQTVSTDANSLQINLSKLNKLIYLDVVNKEVTVQAGMTWLELQKTLAINGLAVKAMQSYNSFSIGGSLGVNVHGQDLVDHPLISTVKSFKLLKADGTIVLVSRTQNSELFGAAIGGYGLFGIITEVTLQLTDDVVLEGKASVVETKDFLALYKTHMQNKLNVEFGAIRLDLNSNNKLKQGVAITWTKSAKTDPALLKFKPETKKTWRAWLIGFLARSTWLKNWRFWIETKLMGQAQTTSRNNFMGTSIIAELPQDSASKRYILQEYFIPYEHTTAFLTTMDQLIKEYNINMLNITARHINKNTESMLSFSPQDCCAFVLYLEVPRTKQGYSSTRKWSSKLIDKALELSGTYYLPYQLLATKEQFKKSYPRFDEFVALKKKHDPQGLFSNSLYTKYAL